MDLLRGGGIATERGFVLLPALLLQQQLLTLRLRLVLPLLLRQLLPWPATFNTLSISYNPANTTGIFTITTTTTTTIAPY